MFQKGCKCVTEEKDHRYLPPATYLYTHCMRTGTHAYKSKEEKSVVAPVNDLGVKFKLDEYFCL